MNQSEKLTEALNQGEGGRGTEQVSTGPAEEKISLLDLSIVVVQNRWLIVKTAFIVALVGAIVSLLLLVQIKKKKSKQAARVRV